jgi:hypothetical protein
MSETTAKIGVSHAAGGSNEEEDFMYLDFL